MSAPQVRRPRQLDYLPDWFEEGNLRRFLACRKAGLSLRETCRRCGISRRVYETIRGVATHSRYPGNRLVASAFLARSAALGTGRVKGVHVTPYTEKEGQALAGHIARWQIADEVPDAAGPVEQREETRRIARLRGRNGAGKHTSD